MAVGVIAACALLAGCGSDDDSSEDPVFREVQDIFAASCGAGPCHFATVPGGGLDLSPGNECEAMIGVASLEVTTMDLVVSGDPAQSYLLCKMTPGCADRPVGATLMPPGNPLPQEQLDVIEQWITEGLPGCSAPAD